MEDLLEYIRQDRGSTSTPALQSKQPNNVGVCYENIIIILLDL